MSSCQFTDAQHAMSVRFDRASRALRLEERAAERAAHELAKLLPFFPGPYPLALVYYGAQHPPLQKMDPATLITVQTTGGSNGCDIGGGDYAQFDASEFLLVEEGPAVTLRPLSELDHTQIKHGLPVDVFIMPTDPSDSLNGKVTVYTDRPTPFVACTYFPGSTNELNEHETAWVAHELKMAKEAAHKHIAELKNIVQNYEALLQPLPQGTDLLDVMLGDDERAKMQLVSTVGSLVQYETMMRV